MRSSRCQKAIKAMALLLVCSVSQVYVQANLVESGATREGKSSTRARRIGLRLAGNLSVHNLNKDSTISKNKSVSVNGNEVGAGTTILSGAQLQLPDNVSASVDLPSLGRLDIAPNTNLTLAFDKGNINVDVALGCVVLTTNEGIIGSVKTPQGIVERAHALNSFLVDVCTGVPGAAAPVVGQGAAADAGAGTRCTHAVPVPNAAGYWFQSPSALIAFTASAAAFLVGGTQALTSGSTVSNLSSSDSSFRGLDTSR